jgi:hypothetical protein
MVADAQAGTAAKRQIGEWRNLGALVKSLRFEGVGILPLRKTKKENNVKV